MKLLRIDLDAAQRKIMEDLVLDIVFEHAAREVMFRDSSTTAVTLSYSLHYVLEVLEAQVERWRWQWQSLAQSVGLPAVNMSKPMSRSLTLLLAELHQFFRHEGSGLVRHAAGLTDSQERFQHLWSELFNQRLFPWLRDQDLYRPDESVLEKADSLVEGAKAWVRFIAEALGRSSPSAEKLPIELVETNVDWCAELTRGEVKLKIRGQPSPILVLQDGEELSHAIMSAPASSETLELHLAELVLHTLLLERTRAHPVPRTSLFLIPAHETANRELLHVPLRVKHAFSGFVGNTNTVRRLQRVASAALERTPSKLKQPVLLHGSAGTGKVELVRRLASALGLPLIHIPGSSIQKVENVHESVMHALVDAQQPVLISEDADSQKKVQYPPLLLFLDEIHELGIALKALSAWIKEERSITLPGLKIDASQISIVAALVSSVRLPDSTFQSFQRIEMQAYTAGDIAAYIEPIFAKANIQPQQSFLDAMAKAARFNPRKAAEFARSYLRALNAGETSVSTASMLDYLWRTVGWDEHGLDALDYHYLQALESGAKALPALQQLLPGLTAEQITLEIEPRLIDLGIVRKHSRGRSLMVKGELLLLRYRNRLLDEEEV